MAATLATFGSAALGASWLTHHWAAMAIAATCAILLISVVAIFGKYVRIVSNLFVDTQPPLPIGVASLRRSQGEEVRFRSFDGTSLRGMWDRTPNRPLCKGAIVFCHEFGSDMYSYARYAGQLIDAGFDVFTFDFRSHGGSSGQRGYRPLQWPSDKELDDVMGACAYVEDALLEEGRSSSVGIFGISRGAGAAILAASSDPNIACMVCDGAFSTRETMVALMKRWAHIFARVKLVYENHPDAFWYFMTSCVMRFAQPRLGRRFPSVREALQTMVARPIMFVHGGKDSYIQPDQARLLYEAAEGPKYHWVVPDARHNQSVVVARKEYFARTVAFFRKYLAGESVGEEELAGLEKDTQVA